MAGKHQGLESGAVREGHRAQAHLGGQSQGGPAAHAQVPQPAAWRCPSPSRTTLFAELEERIAANIEQAIEAGSYEVGVETVTADSLAIAGRETLYEHPGTGAATDLVEIVRRDRLVPLTADAALEIGERDPGPDGKPRLAVNARSKRAAVILPAASSMLDDGGVNERVRLLRPATAETMARAELDASNWRRADEAQWRRVWDAEIAGLPSHRDSRFWLASGLLPAGLGTACRPRICGFAASPVTMVTASSGACSTPSRCGRCAPGSASTTAPS